MDIRESMQIKQRFGLSIAAQVKLIESMQCPYDVGIAIKQYPYSEYYSQYEKLDYIATRNRSDGVCLYVRVKIQHFMKYTDSLMEPDSIY